MNIGIFTDTFYPQVSGVGTSIATLRNQLERMGHTVYIFTTTDPKIEKKIYERNLKYGGKENEQRIQVKTLQENRSRKR